VYESADYIAVSSDNNPSCVNRKSSPESRPQNLNRKKSEAALMVLLKDLIHTTAEKFENAVRPAVYTDPSQKRSFSKALFKTEEKLMRFQNETSVSIFLA